MTIQAETFIELQAQCPHCADDQIVEWADETVNGLEEWTCTHCGEDFTYCHPENQYGLSR